MCFAQILPVARDHDGDRNAAERPERILHIVVSEALEHRVVHLHVAHVRLQLVERVVDGDADDLQPLPARICFWNSMNQGISILHGPHHVAQKSSRTTLPL